MADLLPHDRPIDAPPGAAGYAYAPGSEPLAGYTIKRGLGVGGFGEVYYAVSAAGKEVALKLIRRHLDIELRGVSQCLNLKHPNLVALHDVRTDGAGNHWIVMEYVAGEKLSDLLDRSPQGLGTESAVAWLRGVAAGVQYLHDNGIVHRDLKPGNLFMEQGVVKIGDYGLSKFISVSRRSGHTESVGTVHYMAPEIAGGRYGKEIDVYSLGVILCEMLSGRVPFDGESVGEILMKHLTAEPDLSGLVEPYRTAIAAALEKAPARRPATVAEFVRQLDGESAAPNRAERPALAAASPQLMKPKELTSHHTRFHSLRATKWTQNRLYVGLALTISLVLGVMLVWIIRSDITNDEVAYAHVPDSNSIKIVNGIEVPQNRPAPPNSNLPQPVATTPQFGLEIWSAVALMAIVASSVVAAGVWLMRRTITTSNTPPTMSSVTLVSTPPFTLHGYLLDVTGAWLLAFAASIVFARLLLLLRGEALQLEQFVWTAATTFGATALLAVVGKLPNVATLSPFGFRLLMAGVGAAVGTAAWNLADYLHVSLPFESGFSFVGTHRWPECYADGRPTALAYIGFFGLSFFLIDWRGMIDPARRRTWRFGTTAVAVFWAAVVNAFFPFPQLWGFLVIAGCTMTMPLAFPSVRKVRLSSGGRDD